MNGGWWGGWKNSIKPLTKMNTTQRSLPLVFNLFFNVNGLKVLAQITLENKYCLNFKMSVFIEVAHPKWTKYWFVSCFEVVGEKMMLMLLLMLFIVLLSVVTTLLTRFLLFLRKYPIVKHQISGCEWKNMSLVLVPIP